MNNLQLELLKLYSTKIPDQQLLEIKRLLAQYFARQIDEEMNRLWKEKNWSQETIEGWKTMHERTPYKNQ